ncbi:MAG: FHA domain-containing protein [Acidobacteria bacterium]|nr:FHA domain-containing protein [Acidobacteriota bacterium]
MSFARIYSHFVFGALGGLTGWYLAALWLHSDGVEITSEEQLLRGAILGSCIGFGVGAFDGVDLRSAARLLRYGGVSLLLGLLAGAVALPAAQNLFDRFQTGSEPLVWQGTLCWILFGALIGLGEGVTKGTQAWKGVAGGMLGGMVGGGSYELFGRTADGASSQEQATLALALAALGGAIGAAVAYVTTLLRGAWVVINDGKLAKREFDVSKYVHPQLGARRPGVIGSNGDIYLPGDSEVLPAHATISYVDGAPTLTASAEAVSQRRTTSVNGHPVQRWPLAHGDTIQIGNTSMTFRHKRR